MKPIDWTRVNKIFILSLIPDTVGDTLFQGPLASALKRYAPKAKITITTSPQNKPLLQSHPHFDEIVVLEELATIAKKIGKIKKAFFYFKLLAHALCELQQHKPDICIITQPNFAPSQLLPWIARTPIRIGYRYKHAWFAWTLTHRARFRSPYETNDFHYHYLESNLDLIRAAGVVVKEKDKTVIKVVTPKQHAWAENFMKKNSATEKDIFIALQAGAKWKSKTWPEERFAAVVHELTKNKHIKILLIGSKSEQETNQRIAQSAHQQAILVIGQNTARVAALLEKCALAFGNDSGIMHLASAVGTTPIILYGMSIPDHNGPKGKGSYIALRGATYNDRPILGPEDTIEGIQRMQSITVEKALATIRNLLAQKRT